MNLPPPFDNITWPADLQDWPPPSEVDDTGTDQDVTNLIQAAHDLREGNAPWSEFNLQRIARWLSSTSRALRVRVDSAPKVEALKLLLTELAETRAEYDQAKLSSNSARLEAETAQNRLREAGFQLYEREKKLARERKEFGEEKKELERGKTQLDQQVTANDQRVDEATVKREKELEDAFAKKERELTKRLSGKEEKLAERERELFDGEQKLASERENLPMLAMEAVKTKYDELEAKKIKDEKSLRDALAADTQALIQQRAQLEGDQRARDAKVRRG